jgi:tetratricopeptide (TPR) repeat protein
MEALKQVPNAHPATALPDRYRGVQPFNDNALDRLRFFGRDDEARLLLHQLLGVDLLVLFAMPGLGKTSLLNARLFPLLRERDFLPLPVRFNHPDRALAPMQVFTAAIAQTCQAETIDYTPGETESLWEFFKTAVFWRGDRLQTPVLVLDQFEEIFTLQGEDFRHAAAAELGQLIGRRLPERLRQQLQEGQPLPFSDKPPEVKVVLSLREDDLGMLQDITPEIPTILQNRFRLTGLSTEDARQAITEPARLVEEVQFSTTPFEYDETTVHEMIALARNREGNIDPFFLQLLCSHIEKQVRQRQAGGNPAEARLVVDKSYLGGDQGIKALTANFYLEALDRLPQWQLRRRARRLCEEGLLTSEGRRRSLPIEEIRARFKLDGTSLEPLEHARLLRREARYGSFDYEISHDRLAEAIREHRRWRLPREVKIGLAMFLAVVVVVAALFSHFEAESRRRAEAAREQAEQVLNFIVFDLQAKLTSLGGRALLDDIQKQVDTYYERMGSMGETNTVLRRKAVNDTNRGDLSFNRGNLAAAVTAYQSALRIQEQLAARDPANTEWQRDLSVSYERIGDVQRTQGELATALSAYQQGLQIAERLAARDPANTEWQRDLSVSYERIGGVQRAQGKLDDAIAAYRKQLELKPDHEHAWNSLGIALNKQGHPDEAAAAYAQGLAVQPNDLSLLSNDMELALVQGDMTRFHARMAALAPQVTPQTELFVLLPFFAWLAHPAHDWRNVMTAIQELAPEVPITWDFSDVLPVIQGLEVATQKVAQHFIDFFEGRIDRETLKARLGNQ